ncbi:MAG: hypothetical protein DRP89_04430 [Candidatus Neomarinimicrobiota bacterium]|nr:MAG: hypothetical protein DRP89_04430 [Candidatus Neomarinimicrobiota bacterium]
MTEAVEKSIFTKLISIFWEPSATFRSLKIKTRWFDIVIPILLVSLVSIISIPYVTPIAIEQQKSRIEKSERLSDEQKEMAFERMDKQVGSVVPYVSAPISVAVKCVIIALIMWFAGNFLLGGESKFVPVFAVTAYACLIDIIAVAVKVPLMVSQQTMKVYTSPALFFEESSTFLFRFIATLDVFALWKVILISIGLGVIYDLKTSKAFWVILLLWLGYCVMASLLGGLVKI